MVTPSTSTSALLSPASPDVPHNRPGAVVDPKTGKKIDPAAVNVMTGKAYEEEFEFEKLRRAVSSPCGPSRQPGSQ